MLEQTEVAASFIVYILEICNHFDEETSRDFRRHLSRLLAERFEGHWYPDKPLMGQAYRCIRINRLDRREVTLEKAAMACGLKYRNLKLPLEFTVWIDPDEINYR
jgi:protein Tob/BTG